MAAEAGTAHEVDNQLDDIEKEITCPVCHNVYEKAKLLPCNHYYCSTCIEKMAESARSLNEPFLCPECRKETNLPPGGIAQLKPASFVERLKELHAKMSTAEVKVIICEQCSEGSSIAFCHQCAEFICEDCTRSHRKMKIFSDHVVASLKTLRGSLVNSVQLKDGARKCVKHEKVMELFCLQCEELICHDCTIIKHKRHRFESVTECAPKARKTLSETLDKLKDVQAKLRGYEGEVVSETDELKKQKEKTVKSIYQSFDEMIAVLEARKMELLQQTYSLAEEKDNALGSNMTMLQVAQKEVQCLVNLVQSKVKTLSNQDLMTITKQLQRQMDKEVKTYQCLWKKERIDTYKKICYTRPSPDDIPKDAGSVTLKMIW